MTTKCRHDRPVVVTETVTGAEALIMALRALEIRGMVPTPGSVDEYRDGRAMLDAHEELSELGGKLREWLAANADADMTILLERGIVDPAEAVVRLATC